MTSYSFLYRLIHLSHCGTKESESQKGLNQKSPSERVFVGESLGCQLINPEICSSWFCPKFFEQLYHSSPYNDSKYRESPNDDPLR